MRDIAQILEDARVWFVVGLIDDPEIAAYRVAAFLQAAGKTIVPISPRPGTVLGAQTFASVTAAAKALGAPDVVDVFVRSSRAGAIADEAIAIGAGAVWFQLGVIDEAAAQRVRDAGVDMVMDRCPAIEMRASR